MKYLIGTLIIIIIILFFLSTTERMSTAQKLPLIKGLIGYTLATRESYEDKKENPALIKILYFG